MAPETAEIEKSLQQECHDAILISCETTGIAEESTFLHEKWGDPIGSNYNFWLHLFPNRVHGFVLFSISILLVSHVHGSLEWRMNLDREIAVEIEK